MKTTLTIDGLKDLDAALGEFTKATARNVLQRAGLKAAQPMVDRMRELAPVDLGRLQRSIAATAISGAGAVGKAAYHDVKAAGGSDAEAAQAAHDANAANAGQPLSVVISVGPTGTPNSSLAHLLEFGTVHHRAYPFIRPAFDETKDQVIEGVRTELKSEIDKAAARAARKALKRAGG